MGFDYGNTLSQWLNPPDPTVPKTTDGTSSEAEGIKRSAPSNDKVKTFLKGGVKFGKGCGLILVNLAAIPQLGSAVIGGLIGLGGGLVALGVGKSFSSGFSVTSRAVYQKLDAVLGLPSYALAYAIASIDKEAPLVRSDLAKAMRASNHLLDKHDRGYIEKLEAAAKQGQTENPVALYELACIYKEGKLTPQSLYKAEGYLKDARTALEKPRDDLSEKVRDIKGNPRSTVRQRRKLERQLEKANQRLGKVNRTLGDVYDAMYQYSREEEKTLKTQRAYEAALLSGNPIHFKLEQFYQRTGLSASPVALQKLGEHYRDQSYFSLSDGNATLRENLEKSEKYFDAVIHHPTATEEAKERARDSLLQTYFKQAHLEKPYSIHKTIGIYCKAIDIDPNAAAKRINEFGEYLNLKGHTTFPSKRPFFYDEALKCFDLAATRCKNLNTCEHLIKLYTGDDSISQRYGRNSSGDLVLYVDRQYPLPNPDKAAEYCELRASMLSKDANEQFKLATQFELGNSVPLDFEKAAKYYQKAIDLGHPEAATALQKLGEIDKAARRKEAIDYHENLAYMYEFAPKGSGILATDKLRAARHRLIAAQLRRQGSDAP